MPTTERKRSTTDFFRRGSDYFGMVEPNEFGVALALFVTQIVLLVINVFHRRFDSDEPQHLHVIWGWTHGLVQYRDNFDNHMPLFQIALAPIFALFDERATILFWARFILLPTFFISAWSTYRIGQLLFSQRVGAWSVILLGFYYYYHVRALEFRTDNLWVAFWLLGIIAFLSEGLSTRGALRSGLFLGLCFGVSLKSTLFIVSLATAAALTAAIVGREQWRPGLNRFIRFVIYCLAAAALVPLAIALFFASRGIWRDFRYGVFDFNLLAARLFQPEWSWLAVVEFVGSLIIASRLIRSSPQRALGHRRALVLVTCGAYLILLHSSWRLVTHQDYAPIYPLLSVFVSAALVAGSKPLLDRQASIVRKLPLPALAAIIELGVLVCVLPPWRNHTKDQISFLRDVLRLTNRNDYVFDCKGETIFRPRPLKVVLETITIAAIGHGLLPDDARQRCVATGTCVVAVAEKYRLSRTTLNFIEQNYLPVAKNLSVAGVVLKQSAADPARSEFETVIPASYKLISRTGNISGLLDGVPYEGARFLYSGRHVFQATSALSGAVLLWAQAADRQFTPLDRP